MYVYIYTDYITKKYRQHVHITVLNEMPPDSPWRGSAATSPKKGSVQFPRDQGPAEWDAPGAGSNVGDLVTYPLVNVYTTMENQLFMAKSTIFYGHVQ